ncbi:MAG TPA: hypothetical protein VKG43_00030 [Acidimicrobiales bacterium]|nr:hypothetical protein [Acidimicrobiales bacterium]
MSTTRELRPLPNFQRTEPDPVATLHHDAVMRSTAILGLVGVAVVHFAQVVQTTEQTPYLGVAFLGLALAAPVVAAMLLHRASARVWVAVAAINVAAISGYVFTRLVSTPFDNQDVGNWSEGLGLAALFIEVLLVALAAYALTPGAPNRRPDPELTAALARQLADTAPGRGGPAERPPHASSPNGLRIAHQPYPNPDPKETP